MIWRYVGAATLLLFASSLAAPRTAAADKPAFDVWLRDLQREAAANGIGKATIDSALVGLKPIPRVIELDRRQPEFTLTFQQYIDRVVPQSRVEKGKQRLNENRELLERISKKYGVQSRFIVAFWGIETDFGRVTGGFPVIAALATLAYDGRRSSYFRKELMYALEIVDRGHIGAKEMMGSWAGAMGQAQFMPSSFKSFAVDGDGDGRIDLWTNKADVFASAANYLARSGWKGDETWGRPVKLPEGFDTGAIGAKVRKPIAAWQAMGVRRPDGGDLPKRDLKAAIVLGDGKSGPAFLVYDNYHTILKWNRSVFFAVAVGSLADRIGGG